LSIIGSQRRLSEVVTTIKRLLTSSAVEKTKRLFAKPLSWYEKIVAFCANPYVVWFLFFALLAVILGYYPSRTEDYDLWYHLKFGEHFLTNRTCDLDHSMFSWTPADPTWRYGIWIGSSILYLIYSVFGIYGLFVMQWSIFFAIMALYVRFIKLTEDRLDMNHLLSLLMVFIALNLTAIYIKPELFTTLFFTVTVFLYFYIKYTSKNLFLVYPPLLFLWVNTHGGYLVGLGFLGMMLVGETVNKIIKRSQLSTGLYKSMIIAVVASYIAVIFNPYGIDYHIAILKTFVTKKYMDYGTQVLAWENMWANLGKPYSYRFYNTAWSLTLMVASFVIVSVVAFVRKRFIDISLLLVTGGLYYIGMQAARVTIFLPLFWMFAMAYVLKKAELIPVKRYLAPISLILLIVTSTYLTRLTVDTLEDRSWFGNNIVDYAPVKEVEFVKRYHLPGPIFNDYVIGAYLIWRLYPDYKVFIDPRYGPYWQETGPDYFDFMYNMSPENLNRFHAKYPFRTAIIDMKETGLINFLMTSPGWRLIYFDKSAVVIVEESVMPTLSREALSVDMSTSKFSDVDNPEVLERVFNFYLNINRDYAMEILELYKKNVSDYYDYKYPRLKWMRYLLNSASNQARQ